MNNIEKIKYYGSILYDINFLESDMKKEIKRGKLDQSCFVFKTSSNLLFKELVNEGLPYNYDKDNAYIQINKYKLNTNLENI